MIEALIAGIITIFPLIPLNNWILAGVKVVAQEAATRAWLRGTLVILSLVGVIASSAISGTEIDFNQISDLWKLFLETAGLVLASHFSYRVTSIKSKS